MNISLLFENIYAQEKIALIIFVRQCHKPEDRGFNPDEITNFFFNLPTSSNRAMVLELTQPLTEINTMKLPGE
jgi:hypothetical protein